MKTINEELQEVADRYLPLDLEEDYPAAHLAAEGCDGRTAYTRSMVDNMASDVADEIVDQTHAVYYPFFDIILLREYDDEEMNDVSHEHEFVHRLSFTEREKSSTERVLDSLYGLVGRSYTDPEPGDPEEFLRMTVFEPEDGYETVTDPEMAARYGVDEEMTEAVRFSDRDFASYYGTRSEMQVMTLLEFDGEDTWHDDATEGTLSIDMDEMENDQFDEFITHYLTADEGPDDTLRRRGFDDEEIYRAHEALQELDRAAGYDPGKLVRLFGRCETLEDLLSASRSVFGFREGGEARLNGYLVSEGSGSVALHDVDD